MAQVIQFVDSIAGGAAVRLDLHDGTAWTCTRATAFPPPPLARATVSSALADGSRVTTSRHDNRTLHLDLELRTSGADAQATQIQTLARELDRERNILRWQAAGMTTPVYFRTFRSGLGQVQDLPSRFPIALDLLAEPYAYGLKTTLAAVTVYNDPVEGTTLNANPYFETNANNWTGSGCTFVRSTAQFHEGAASGLATPDGVTATVEVASEQAGTLSAGQIVRFSAWVRCAVTRSVVVGVNWYTSGGGFISANSSSFSLTLNTWTFVHVTFAAPATTGKAQMKFQMTGTPAASNLLYIDEARVNVVGTSGGSCWEITGVKGDVDTPVIISMPADTVYSASGERQSLFATRRGGTPSAAPFVVQAEAATLGTDVAAGAANDTAMSGAGANYARYTPATAPTVLGKRLTLAAPADSTDLRGTYRVFVRYRKSTSDDVFGVAVKWAAGTQANTEVTLPAGTVIRYVDLGLMSWPYGADPQQDAYTNTNSVVAGTTTEIWARRVSGAGTLDFDLVMFVPADESTCYCSWSAPNDATHTAVLDGIGGGSGPRLYLKNAAGSVYSLAPRVPVGGVPKLRPGVTNRIVFVRDVGTAASVADAISGSTALTVAYHPRYLYVAPAAT